MAKAVLVMDEMPEDCTMCKLWNSKDDECYATGVEELSLNSEEAKPDWCPLRELPEKIPELKSGYEDLSTSIRRVGWNACLDEILN
ncbi:MAG: hypothetical protein KH160_13435 [Ruminococcus sp.]|nr:hypothetical protein [Ruminococcus sp.]